MRQFLIGASLGVTLASAAFAAPQPDGAVIENSGSTNSAGWRIVLRSNGQATTQVVRRLPATPAAAAAFTPDPALVEAFFRDVRAARDAGTPAATCMKSASFGSRTIVTWHDWSSGDLSCPGNTGTMAALAQDVAALQNAGHVTALPLYRRYPIETEGTPAPSPSSMPRPAAKEGAAARQSHRP